MSGVLNEQTITAREKLARWLCQQRNGVRGWDYEPGRRYWLEDADALLPLVREIADECRESGTR